MPNLESGIERLQNMLVISLFEKSQAIEVQNPSRIKSLLDRKALFSIPVKQAKHKFPDYPVGQAHVSSDRDMRADSKWNSHRLEAPTISPYRA